MTVYLVDTYQKHNYQGMARDLEVQLRNILGDVKFQEWWDYNVTPLNGQIVWDHRSLYLILKDKYNEIQELREWYDQHYDERP